MTGGQKGERRLSQITSVNISSGVMTETEGRGVQTTSPKRLNERSFVHLLIRGEGGGLFAIRPPG